MPSEDHNSLEIRDPTPVSGRLRRKRFRLARAGVELRTVLWQLLRPVLWQLAMLVLHAAVLGAGAALSYALYQSAGDLGKPVAGGLLLGTLCVCLVSWGNVLISSDTWLGFVTMPLVVAAVIALGQLCLMVYSGVAFSWEAELVGAGGMLVINIAAVSPYFLRKWGRS